MIRKYILLSFLLGSMFIYAQEDKSVGINTEDPKQVLDVNGGFRYEEDGVTMKEGQYLKSDNNGNATWVNISPEDISTVMQPNYQISRTEFITYQTSDENEIIGARGNIYNTGTSITLPPGDWIVFISMNAKIKFLPNYKDRTTTEDLPTDKAVWLRTTLSEKSVDKYSQDGHVINSGDIGTKYNIASKDLDNPVLVSGNVNGKSGEKMVYGQFTLHNTSTVAKTYYYWVQAELANFKKDKEGILLENFANPTLNPGSSMIAIKLDDSLR